MPNAYVCLLFFRWSNQGTKVLPRTKKLYRKSYFYITTESGPDSKFRKEVYQPLERSITIVHYIGNEALSVSHAHGNTRQQAKLFFRTKPSVFKNIESKIELKAPHKVYKELVCFVLLLFNVPVNNFSVMLRRSHLFLGITSTFGG